MAEKPVITNTLQAGGHGGKNSLIFEGPKCYKPTLAPREAQWYHDLVDGKLPPELAAKKIVPMCYGFEKRTDPVDGEETEYVVIENLVWKFKHPSILDIKLGTHTDHPDCGPAKLKTHLRIDAITTTPVLGYRFGGMNVYQSATHSPKVFGKTYGISCDPEKIEEPFTEFLHSGEAIRYDVLPAFIEKLKVVRDFLAKRTHNFYAASILFVYDTPDEDGEVGSEPEARLIDFAHVWDVKDYDVDSGALFGVENLIKTFESMAKKGL